MLLLALITILAIILTTGGILTRIKSSAIQAYAKLQSYTFRLTAKRKSKCVSTPDLGRYRLTHAWWPCQEEWLRTKGGIFYFSLGSYVPNRYNFSQYPFLNPYRSEIAHMRQLVWDFKYNLDRPSPIAHARSVEEAVRRVSYIINRSFAGLTPCITFLCLPASSNLVYNLRFREFAALVCRETGMTDAFDFVHVRGEKTPKHLGGSQAGSFIVDHEWLTGRNLILFDDVISSGHTIDAYGEAFGVWDARVLCAITLVRTVSQVGMKQGIYRTFSLEAKLKAFENSMAMPYKPSDKTGMEQPCSINQKV